MFSQLMLYLYMTVHCPKATHASIHNPVFIYARMHNVTFVRVSEFNRIQYLCMPQYIITILVYFCPTYFLLSVRLFVALAQQLLYPSQFNTVCNI